MFGVEDIEIVLSVVKIFAFKSASGDRYFSIRFIKLKILGLL